MLESARAEYRAQLAGDGELTDLVVVENQLAQLWLLLGRADLAKASFVSDPASTEARFRVRRLTLQLRAARIAGRSDEATASALRALIDQAPISINGAMAELELSRSLEPARALEQLQALCERPVLIERPGLRMHALTLMAAAARRTGDTAQARRHVESLLELDAQFLPFDMDPREAWSVAHAVLSEAGDAASRAAADATAARSAEWLRAVRERGLPAGAAD